jgi:hypothetical protein
MGWIEENPFTAGPVRTRSLGIGFRKEKAARPSMA